ncbi:fimbrial biogenesis outer membrane usher protein [Stagnimonas aquatica]|uniref:Fimbrial biogenesis outer membrane usher protein n=1 Tax=Stagnimonas aquatica TaxID=2689987 RepID=A0A3N0VLK7_9GAMM|nr:fimbrial biogenesis outer membrane usher protein [Stagnimonas aquatica]
MAEGELRLQVDPTRLPAQQMDLGYGRTSPAAHFPRSSYLNYGLDLSRFDADGEFETRVPLELGLRAGRWLARSTAQLADGRLSRQYSSLQRDFPERLATLSLGDISGGGSVAGGASLLGLQWSRNFGYQPLVQRAPGLDYVGVLDTPSTVEVYVDDRKVSSTLLPAGPFSLQNLPVQAGLAGNARIEILDAFGQRRVLALPYFLGNNLLKSGESQFSYSLGVARSAGGDRYDRRPALLANHRWGWSEQLTLGYQAAAGEHLGLFGGEADYALGRWGQIGAGQFWGGDPDALGTSTRLGYRYARQRFSVDSNYSRQSAGFYGAPGQVVGDARWLWANRLGASAGALYGTLSYLRGRDNQGLFERYGLNLGSRLGRLGSLSAQLQYDPREREPRLLLTFSTQWRRGPYTQLGYDQNETGRNLSARLSAPVSGYTGAGYRLEASRYEPDSAAAASRLSADLDWRQPAFTGLLSRQQDATQGDSSRALIAGSLLLHDGGFDLGQPVRGSFVSVEVEGLPGAEIYADGRRIGRTGADRGVSISDLTPYLDHRLTVLLPTDLPIGTDLPEASLPLTLAEGGGQRLVFRPRRLRLYEGTLQREDGSAVEFAPLVLRRGEDAPVNTASGEGGYLYLQDLEPGEYRLEAGGSRPCGLRLQLPDGRETYSHLGRLTCLSE